MKTIEQNVSNDLAFKMAKLHLLQKRMVVLVQNKELYIFFKKTYLRTEDKSPVTWSVFKSQ